jgi:hypothetical protein
MSTQYRLRIWTYSRRLQGHNNYFPFKKLMEFTVIIIEVSTYYPFKVENTERVRKEE